MAEAEGGLNGGGSEFVATIQDGSGKLGFKLAQQRVPGDFYAFVVEHVDPGGPAEACGASSRRVAVEGEAASLSLRVGTVDTRSL